MAPSTTTTAPPAAGQLPRPPLAARPADASLAPPPEMTDTPGRSSFLQRFERVRAFTRRLCKPLATEDYVIQSMPDVSPAKWHLAHTTWFFERFILQNHPPGGTYQPYVPAYDYLFNSYYNTVGPMHCRLKRGLLSRPTVAQVYAYRDHVDEQIHQWVDQANAAMFEKVLPVLILGLHHEQQHQELLLTDIKHVFSSNPLLPAYHETNPAHRPAPVRSVEKLDWCEFEGGVYDIGCDATQVEFCFDNETPRHRCYLQPFALASRLVTNREYLAFIEDGGYDRPELWLSMGWATIREQGWRHPIYWYRASQGDTDHAETDQWMQYTLAGPTPIALDEPVCHVSYFEADAFARWSGCRLPTEAEWEVAADGVPVEGNFAESGTFHPQTHEAKTRQVAALNPKLETRNPERHQMFGDVWEWTSSQYSPYPGYHPLPGALGEYNGKFMCNQFVLRGGSCATSKSHIRNTYRNFFPPDARWQFTGLRLARNT